MKKVSLKLDQLTKYALKERQMDAQRGRGLCECECTCGCPACPCDYNLVPKDVNDMAYGTETKERQSSDGNGPYVSVFGDHI